MIKPHHESRTYFRVSFQNPLQFLICSSNLLSELHVASSQNVSQSGICFLSKTKPPLGSILKIQTDLKTLASCIRVENMLFELEGSVLGKVAWARPSQKEPDWFDVGVAFIKLEEAHHPEIKEAVELLA